MAQQLIWAVRSRRGVCSTGTFFAACDIDKKLAMWSIEGGKTFGTFSNGCVVSVPHTFACCLL